MKLILPILFLALCVSTSFSQTVTTKKSEASRPFVLGQINEIMSNELNEKRTLNIYLPEGYNAKDTVTYPVIYLLDGSADEDFIHMVGLVQFNSFEWVDRVPKSIVVGIATADRRRDFTFPTTIERDKKAYPTAGHSDRFISFIDRELQPYIRATYKTNNSKTIVGQSLGGLLATEILIKKPALFTKYIIVSPSLWWNDGSLLKQPVSAFSDTDIYIGVGKEGLTPTEVPRVMEVDANLLADKLKSLNYKNVHVYFDYLPSENHATIMHQAVSNSFSHLYPKASNE